MKRLSQWINGNLHRIEVSNANEREILRFLLDSHTRARTTERRGGVEEKRESTIPGCNRKDVVRYKAAEN
jgi:hypothetical protein